MTCNVNMPAKQRRFAMVDNKKVINTQTCQMNKKIIFLNEMYGLESPKNQNYSCFSVRCLQLIHSQIKLRGACAKAMFRL